MSTLLQIDKTIPRVFAAPTCRKCGGKCCEAYPGSASPVQFGAPDRRKLIVNLVDASMSGKWQVDWWEGESRGYFVRAAIKFEQRIKSPSWGGPCTFLSPTGCVLRAANKPAECTALKPNPPNCGGHETGKKFYADLWEPYWDEIDYAVEAVAARRGGPDV